MKKSFFRIYLVLFLFSVAATVQSDSTVEEQKARLLDMIVSSEDPEVRKKLLLIYENLEKDVSDPTVALPTTSGYSQ